MESTEEMITIPKAEMDRLRELEEKYTIIKPKYDKLMHNHAERVNAYNKAHPEKHRAAVQRWKDTHREEYNARRRELRRLKKEAAAAANPPADGGAGMAFAPPIKTPAPK
jgi:3-methyladenine DNA glycosylase AlkC